MGKKVSEIVTAAAGLLLAGLLTVCDGFQSNGGIGTEVALDPTGFNAAILPASTIWQSVAFGNGKFVAIAINGTAAYSTDGINWATVNTHAVFLRGIAYGNDRFVAVCYLTNIAVYSTDGINWSQATLPSKGYWTSVAFGNGVFVAVADSSSNMAAYSADGINWSQATMPASANWNDVTYGNGRFVAVGYNGTAAYSTDGINWSQATMPANGEWRSVAFGNGVFVAVGYNGIAAYSTDGINWATVPTPNSANMEYVTFGNDRFVAVSYNSNAAAYILVDVIVALSFNADGSITWKKTG